MDETTDTPDVPWTMGKWGGFTQWKCKFCAWDTLDGEEAMWEHYAAVHAPPEPVKPVTGILRADRWGNPVQEPIDGKNDTN